VWPSLGVVADAAGNLYGTTDAGGANDEGTVFEIKAGSGAVTILATFNDTYGGRPFAGLIADAAGNLYGTTVGGGAYGTGGYGTVFEIKAGSGAVTTLASFNSTNGAWPIAGVIADAAGDLYGTTVGGGANKSSTVFEIKAGSGAVTTLASFNSTNGTAPHGGLIADAAGDLYGTTSSNGSSATRIVFEIKAGSGAVTTLATFNGTYGTAPGLIADAAGNLYGTTAVGGANGQGTVFELTNTGFVVSTSASPKASLAAIAPGSATLVVGTEAAPTTLRITTGGAVTLNASDTYATVLLDQETNLTLSKLGFITAVGQVGGNTIVAAAANQTLGGLAGGDTLVGYSGFGDTFQGTAAGLNGDTIKGFGGSDLIDLTNIAFASATLSWSGTGTSGTLSVTDGSHAAGVTLSAGSGFAKSAFSLISDLHGGTEVKFV
jgi:uncharacterized repeat protein (TIGR03803 family)